jgi:amino acid transporter
LFIYCVANAGGSNLSYNSRLKPGTPAPGATDLDKELLHSMGYAQELRRGMRTFQNFAISFSIICILAGGINSFGQGLSSVGGASIGIGWPLATGFSLLFALAMGQIGSAYPTAGGLYHWGSILGGRATGWITAWCNLLGLVAVLGAINVGTYLFTVGSFLPNFGVDTSALMPATPTFQSILIQAVCVSLITASQAMFNHFGIKLTTKLTDFSGYLIFFTAVGLTVTLLVCAHGIDLSRLWTFHNYSGEAGGNVWPQNSQMGQVFLLGLLLPAYTITGFDASAHTAEETIDAARTIPKGMVHSVLWSGVFGFVMLAAIVLAAPNLDEAAKQGAGSFGWILGKTVPEGPRLVLLVLIAASQYLCGLATVTSTSRMTYAFARDGGLPFSDRLRSVSPRYRTPVVATWTVAVLAVALTIYSPVYTTLAAMCAILLYVSYALPIVAGMLAYRRSWTKMGSFQLGGWFRPICALCMMASLVLIWIGVQPPNDIALKVLTGAAILAAVIWFGLENRRFKGPPTGATVADRQSEIAAAEGGLEG